MYRCEWETTIGGIFVHRYARSKDIDDFTSGFWIDYDHRFTKGSDAAYWIPPTAIKYIQKEVKK